MTDTNTHPDRIESGEARPREEHGDAEPRRARGGRLRRLGFFLALPLALLIGLAAGVRWHEDLAHLVTPHVREGSTGTKQLWTCSMHPQVIKEEPGICPICHMKLEPLETKGGGGTAPAGAPAERKVKYYWDPMMNPPYISEKPGKSPMGMDLVPVYEDEVRAGSAVQIDPVVVQNMGVRLASVSRGAVRQDIRAVGYLDEAQPNVRDVNLRVSGWVEKLYADTVGMALSKGDPLFDLYSPEVQVAVEELIAARRSLSSLGPNADALAKKTAESLFEATRLKLEQWGLDREQVTRLSKSERAPRAVTFTSPIDGYLMQKVSVQGAAVKAGDMAFQIVDLSTLWLDSQVYAQDLPLIALGQRVTATVEGMHGKELSGEVIFVHPQVDPQTRTATVRMAIPNMELKLRPGMFATAHIHAGSQAESLLIPREAVIDTGTRQIVFVSEGEGHFAPRKVTVGASGNDGQVQVLGGLKAGETVVTSGQFLLDAESRMREAIQKHLTEKLASAPGGASHGSHAKPAEVSPEKPSEHAGHGEGVAPAPTTTATASSAVDRVVGEYLKVQAVLGAPQKGEGSVEVEGLVTAAAYGASTDGALMKRISDAAAAMNGKPLPEQRRLYKALSETVLELAKKMPPSRAVSEKLIVAYCPMAPGKGARWLQTGETVANPYFATSMKECGEIEESLPLAGAPKR